MQRYIVWKVFILQSSFIITNQSSRPKLNYKDPKRKEKMEVKDFDNYLDES